MVRRSLLLAIALLAGAADAAEAQFFEFGQNKIQYRRFDWRVLKGEHVDLYYYPAEEELAHTALAYAEESYDSLAIRFCHEVPARIPLIVYGSTLVLKALDRFPLLITAGGALLGWIAGEVLVTDPVLVGIPSPARWASAALVANSASPVMPTSMMHASRMAASVMPNRSQMPVAADRCAAVSVGGASG